MSKASDGGEQKFSARSILVGIYVWRKISIIFSYDRKFLFRDALFLDRWRTAHLNT